MVIRSIVTDDSVSPQYLCLNPIHDFTWKIQGIAVVRVYCFYRIFLYIGIV